MYRKIDGTEAPTKFEENEVPRYLIEEIEAETEKMVKEQLVIEEKLLNMQLKVYHDGELQDVSFRKSKTLSELILLCYEKFGIEGRDVTDARIRSYDAIMKVRLGVFDKYE